jgi:hypothetical protein
VKDELWVGTAITANYIHKAMPLLRSLGRLTGVRRFCATVNFSSSSTLAGVECYPMRLDPDAHDVDPDYVCLQHGPFLEALPPEAEHILLVDADAIFQRDLLEAERRQLLPPPGTLAAAWNCGVGDTLFDELARLQPWGVCRDSFFAKYPELRNVPVYNCGFLAGHRETWTLLCEAYRPIWREYRDCFRRKTKTQFCLCAAIYAAGIAVDVVGPGVHSHGHFSQHTWRISSRHAMVNGRLTHEGRTVLFAHAIEEGLLP